MFGPNVINLIASLGSGLNSDEIHENYKLIKLEHLVKFSAVNVDLDFATISKSKAIHFPILLFIF